MKLTDIVAKHGFKVSDIADIKNAKLYTRINQDGVLEILCVQKLGDTFRIDRLPLIQLAPDVLIPIGEGISNKMVSKEEAENYLNTTLPG